MKKRHIVLAAVATLVSVAVIFLIAVYGFGMLQRGTADFRGETEQIEKTQADGDYRIASYNEFFDKCASIQSLEDKVANLREEAEATDDKQRMNVLDTSITAAKNKRAELIASYNADARKEATQGQFKSSDLPYQLDTEEGDTVCDLS